MQDYCPDAEEYNHVIVPMERSKPRIPMEVLLEATKPVKSFAWDEKTDMSVGGVFIDLVAKILSIFNFS